MGELNVGICGIRTSPFAGFNLAILPGFCCRNQTKEESDEPNEGVAGPRTSSVNSRSSVKWNRFIDLSDGSS